MVIRQLRVPLLCLAVYLLLAFGLPTLITYGDLLKSAELYFLWGTFLVGLWCWSEVAPLSAWKQWKTPLAVGLGITTILFLSLGVRYRILADETNLIAPSLSFYLDRTFKLITEGFHYFEAYHVTNFDPPIRPGLFSFCMYLLHSLFGYNAGHGFYVNFVVTALLLAGVFHYMRGQGAKAAFSACAFLASYPLFALSATSSGFEPINLLFIFLLLPAGQYFFEAPSLARFEVLFATALLGSQCRYETLVVFGPLVVVALLYRKRLGWKWSWRTILLLILTLPIVWQRMQMGTRGLQLETKKELFSVSNLIENKIAAGQYFLNLGEGNHASSPAVFVLALVGLVFFVARWLKQGRPVTPSHKAILLAAASISTVMAAQFAYSEGNYLLPADARLAVSVLAFLAMVAAFGLAQLEKYLGGWLALGLVMFVCVDNLTTASRNERGESLLLYREYAKHLEFLKDYPKDSTLVISDRPGMYAVQLYSAAEFRYVNNNYDDLTSAIKRHLYQNVFVIQKVNYADGKATPAMDSRYQLKPVLEYQNSSEYFIRISRVS